ncbi:hypothetical protein AXG93_2841s1070 [Marchantia polymorpha subsp. ruderalis]|uniref:YDG domain-containing protein n=1 Tax=Marchantia polymorpha subsp. ruderalis TaxID=1480154 RepID=A0A176WRV7_MARPO|nr:hypothetical protein AXG93_2841s1070 [Marchantia polymorpha subsp. ruderalis]
MTRVVAAKNGKKLLLSKGTHSKRKSLLQFASKAQDKPRGGMQSRRQGPSYNFRSKDANVQILLDQFDTFREKYRKKKNDESVAMKTLHPIIVQWGIDYLPAIRSPAMIDGESVSIAISVVLSGEKDDIDEVDTIHYCGEGRVGRRGDGIRITEVTED